MQYFVFAGLLLNFLQHHMDTLLLATFGIFAATLVNLHDVEPTNHAEKEELASMISLGKTLFIDIVQDGVTSLKERCATESVEIDGQMEEAFEFICNGDNFEGTICEWVAASDFSGFFGP